MQDGHLLTQFPNTGIPDIVTIIDPPEEEEFASFKPSGVAKVFSYTKPVTDWKVFTGDPFVETDLYIEHTQTGIDSTPLRRHKYVAGENEYFLKAANFAVKQKVDIWIVIYQSSGIDVHTGVTGLAGMTKSIIAMNEICLLYTSPSPRDS